MIPIECKRLAEVDFPLAEVSRHAAREKSIRHGHPSTLHLWWARRPLAACRSMLLALLLPDPCDPHCPAAFKARARELVSRLFPAGGGTDEALRKALLDFIGDFANWDNAAKPVYLEIGRGLVQAAHPDDPPLVVDPFAGGGSIPLEALRLGCDAFASDLNPVACLILKTMLEDIPRHGPELADELRRVGAEIKAEAERELADLYPRDPDGAMPIAYLWARTVRCEQPDCGAEIPLMRSLWLCKKASRRQALRYRVERPAGHAPRVEFEIFKPQTEDEVDKGTINRASATCPACGQVLPGTKRNPRVPTQLAAQSGGADVLFDGVGHRIGGARLLAVVVLREDETGRRYRLPVERDYQAIWRAQRRLSTNLDRWREGPSGSLCPAPDEPTPAGGGSGASRAFSVQRYGMSEFANLFSARQQVALSTIAGKVNARPDGLVRSLLGLALGRVASRGSSLCVWRYQADQEKVEHVFGRQALPIVWDFAEAVPISDATGSWADAVEVVAGPISGLSNGSRGGTQQADSAASPLPSETASVWFTDPPYYDAIPYSDLSDYFLVWLKRSLIGHPLLSDPFDPSNPLSPKGPEAVQDETRIVEGRAKDRAFFEETMARAFAEGRRVTQVNGAGCVVFAHKTTEGWEALLTGMVQGEWTITGSWPIATEMKNRLRARSSAALATSVHLVCRPRPSDAPTGDWSEVYRELPQRVGQWMARLQREGVRGADLVFACIGPALEIYSRYSKVLDASDREIPLGGDPTADEPHLRGYLAYVWETVARLALEEILGTAEAKARNGGAGALEEDARLTSLFLWTLQAGDDAADQSAAGDDDETEEDDDDEEGGGGGSRKKAGLKLIHDVVRRFAQPLGIHLEVWEGRIIETEKGVVRLLPVAERAAQLFGEEDIASLATAVERDPHGVAQMVLPGLEEQAAAPQVKGRGRRGQTKAASQARPRRDATTLDRVHAAMLLQKGGQTNALRAMLTAEQESGPDFLRLANALAALYPRDTEERRLLEAMVQAAPR